MKRIGKLKYPISILLAVVLTAIVTLGGCYVFFTNRNFTPYSKLGQIEDLVKSEFLGEHDKKAAEDLLASAYIDSLSDPYAAYISVENAEKYEMSRLGEGEGIGIYVRKPVDSNRPQIIYVYELSPAEKAGFKSGDYILEVDGKSSDEIGYSKIIDALNGEKKEVFSVTVLRGDTEIELNVESSNYEVQSVFVHRIGDIGFVRITEFNDHTDEEFIEKLTTLISGEVKGLIFDVRQNMGGTVSSVTKVIDYLVPEGNILSVKYADGTIKTTHTSDTSEVELPMAVLCDRKTASAGELFTASIRDYSKGVIIGEKTYGKGVMQRSYNLDDGSVIKFTVAEYFPKSMIGYDGVGIAPDIEIETEKQKSDSFYFFDFENDTEIQRAIKYLNEQIKED